MLDLRMVLWFIFGVAFAAWSFILVFRVQKLLKQFLISNAIWFVIMIVQLSTKQITMPSVAVFPQEIIAYPMSLILYNWFPSFLVVLLPISIYFLIKDRRKAKSENNGEGKK